jgi:hypothetical protein
MPEVEIVESAGILIEFDHPLPPPPVTFPVKEKIWTKRVQPQRHFPGRTARVLRDLPTRKGAVGQGANIMRSLRKADKYEDWTMNVRKEENNTWSIYLTYNGRLNEEEYQQRETRRAAHYARNMAISRRKQLEAAQVLGHSVLSGSLKPPTV